MTHITEFLSAEATRELFEQLRADYDYIIVDLPPLAPVVDVRASSMLIDRFVLVVQWGRSKIDTVQHALHTAPNVYQRMMGWSSTKPTSRNGPLGFIQERLL